MKKLPITSAKSNLLGKVHAQRRILILHTYTYVPFTKQI